jgi:hypothetical protein
LLSQIRPGGKAKASVKEELRGTIDIGRATFENWLKVHWFPEWPGFNVLLGEFDSQFFR